MKQPIVAVFDKKTGLYENPFAVVHVGVAIREWKQVLENKESRYGKNSEDFAIYHTANYDFTTGQYENVMPPTALEGH